MINKEQEYGYGDVVCCGDDSQGYVSGIIMGLTKPGNNIWYNVETENKNSKYRYVLSTFPVHKIRPRRTVLIEKINQIPEVDNIFQNI